MHDGKEHKKSDLDLLRRLPVPRGRMVIAVILVTTMAFMWARLLFSGKGGGPAAASGAGTAVASGTGLDPRANAQADAKAPARLTRVDLPVIAGRHDRLARDFFTTTNWKAFQSLEGGPSRAAPVDPAAQQDLTDHDVRIIEQNLQLDGIIAEQNRNGRQAFINGRLASVGSEITVEYKSLSLKLKVLEIQKNNVILGLEKFTLNVAMPQADSLNN